MRALRRSHRWNVVLFVVFLFGILFVLTGVWQLAFVAGLVGGVLGKRPRRDFGIGFLGTSTAWGGHLAWAYVYRPAGDLAALFVEILGLSAGAGPVVPALTLLIGGVTGGLGALVGAYAGELLRLTDPEEVVESSEGA